MKKKSSRGHHAASTEANGVRRTDRGKVTHFLGHFDNKEDAIEFARKISRQQGTELIIHGKDGKIQSDSHGNDHEIKDIFGESLLS